MHNSRHKLILNTVIINTEVNNVTDVIIQKVSLWQIFFCYRSFTSISRNPLFVEIDKGASQSWLADIRISTVC